MRICFAWLLTLGFLFGIKAQEYCKYEAEEFEEYVPGITSELGGLFPNAFTLHKKSIQIESNLSLAPKNVRHESGVFTSVSQVRYGINSKLEMRLGYTYVYPEIIEADTGTHSQLLGGIKVKLFTVSGRNIEWNTALSGSYFIENLKSGSNAFPGGYYAFLNSSLKFYDLVRLDITIGSLHNLKRNSFLGLLSTEILVKRSDSKWGFFAGLGGIYIESYINAGILYTDNYNYILHLAVMGLDNAYAMNVCYTHCFKW